MTTPSVENIAALQEQRRLLLEKKAFFERELLIRSDPNQLFQLKQDLAQISDALAAVEGKLSSEPQRDFGQDLYNALLQLNYDLQVKMFRPLANKEKLAAVLLHGPGQHGQRWLVNRMLRTSIKREPRKFRFNLNQVVAANDAAYFWRQLASGFKLPPRSTPEQVAERICACRKTQHVIFFMDCLLDGLEATGLADFIRDFWLPLVEVARRDGPADYFLLLLLIDQSGCRQPQPLQFREGYSGDVPFDPTAVVRLPGLKCFAGHELETWLNMAPVIEYLPDLQDLIVIPDLLASSRDGIPEKVFDEICAKYNFDWLIGVDEWLTLY